MRKESGSEFLYQLFALMFSFIVIHSIYVMLIRPNADAIVQHQMAQQAAGEVYVEQRSVYVVLKDYEQETCLVLMLWALLIMGHKAYLLKKERAALHRDLLTLNEGTSILPDDTRNYARVIQQLPASEQRRLAPRVLLLGLQRFGSTEDVAAAATAVKDACDAEADRLDSELSMIRYIGWAIPSIGFIGTVRGIGAALGQAHRAVEGDIAGVTLNLGVAFNSTFIALVISIFIMFFSHQLQLQQERLVQRTLDYCDDKLLSHLKTGQL
ncbi:MotA/TolQ/ExbB proton channel family protein [Flocculibacter collagenilyticus]|uniref:MotA/TolQ/ExbB proton channel family protein n=1 Tax=Flocculibacter collagenilyticus TaxID=2744479 RepID=UPI0018F54724|nr:MotA/TolQ/ExbB proton channel family protein [Flocculibacter collagenilyticus]